MIWRLTILLLVAAWTARGASSRWSQMYSDIDLNGQSGWSHQSNSYTIYGTWVATVGTPYGTAVTGNITLGETLDAGTWYLFTKASQVRTDTNRMEAQFGGGSAVSFKWNTNGQVAGWCGPIAITNTVATNLLTLRCYNSAGTNSEVYALLGVYLTTNYWDQHLVANDNSTWVKHGDAFITYPAQSENTDVTLSSNLIKNASFECGAAGGTFTYTPTTGFPELAYFKRYSPSLQGKLVDSDAYHGARSFYSGDDAGELSFAPVEVRANRKHVASLYVKNPQVAGTLRVRQMGGRPNGSNSVVNVTATIPTSSSWQRVAITNVLTEYPTTWYQVAVTLGTNSWVDAVQLVESSTNVTFAPRATLELGGTVTLANVWHTTASFPLVLFNNSGDATNATAKWELRGEFGQLLSSGESTFSSVPAGVARTNQITYSSKFGPLKLLAWLPNVPDSLVESVGHLIGTPNTNPTNGWLMGHWNLTEHQLDASTNMGIWWDRMLSPDTLVRWNLAEPQDDVFTYFDTLLSRATNRNVRIVANLIGDEANVPAFALSGGQIIESELAEYVTNIVLHYKPWIHAWEMGNEVNYDYSASEYTNISRIIYNAIKTVDSQSTVLGWGGIANIGSWTSFADTVIAAGWMDAASYHEYPYNQAFYPTRRDDVGTGRNHRLSWEKAAAYGKEIWHSEGGSAYDYGWLALTSVILPSPRAHYTLGAPAFTLRVAEAADSSAWMALASAIQARSWNAKRFAIYDNRITDNWTFNWLDRQYFFRERDDTIRPKVTPLLIFDRLFGVATGTGPVTNGGHAIYTWAKETNSWAAVYSTNLAQWNLTLATNVGALDWMGNPAAVSSSGPPNAVVRVGRVATYLCFTNIGSSTASNLLKAATWTAVADTNAPTLLVYRFPTTGVLGGERFEWCAADDVSLVWEGQSRQDAIQYRTRWNGGTWSSWGTETTFTAPAAASTWTLDVEARDEATNVVAVYRSFAPAAGGGGGGGETGNTVRSSTLRVKARLGGPS